MSRAGLNGRDHQMHRLRNRALRRVVRAMLIAEVSAERAERTTALARRGSGLAFGSLACDEPRAWRQGRIVLRLVKGANT